MFKLNGFEWRVFLVSPSQPLLIKPDGSLAIGVCDKETQKIYINDMLNDMELKLVLCHEIVHAAMFSYDIRLDYQEEEVVAVLISNYGEEIIDITNSIFSKLSK